MHLYCFTYFPFFFYTKAKEIIKTDRSKTHSSHSKTLNVA